MIELSVQDKISQIESINNYPEKIRECRLRIMVVLNATKTQDPTLLLKTSCTVTNMNRTDVASTDSFITFGSDSFVCPSCPIAKEVFSSKTTAATLHKTNADHVKSVAKDTALKFGLSIQSDEILFRTTTSDTPYDTDKTTKVILFTCLDFSA